MSWRPDWVERRKQRQQVCDRLQSVGGWEALQKECDTLVRQHGLDGFYWHRGDTNALPGTLASLKPWSVEFDPLAMLRAFKAAEVEVVRIKVFGLHRSGAHCIPYYGLEVVPTTGQKAYRPKPSSGGVDGNCYSTFHVITNQIYEVY